VQDDRRVGVWICMVDFIPYLSSPTRGSPSDVALRAHITCLTYPGSNKRAQVLPFSQHRSAKWWCNGAKMKRSAHPVREASCRFGNRGHDCLGPRDFHDAVTAHGELQCVMVLPGAQSITTSRAYRGPPRVC
jgi:hypothetical protein